MLEGPSMGKNNEKKKQKNRPGRLKKPYTCRNQRFQKTVDVK